MEDFGEAVKRMVRTFRRESHRVVQSERTTVLGADGMLMVLQLAMAEVNKQYRGEFSVSLSDVLIGWKHFLLDKLQLPTVGSARPQSYDVIVEEYRSFLRRSNIVDLPDVLHMYKRLGVPPDPEEPPSPMQLFEFLSGKMEDGGVPSRPLSDPGPRRSQVKLWVRRVFCSYLSLLVNAQDDVALATTLDVPARSLGRRAFTDVKHAARERNTSLFLAVTSFVRVLQLGGKGYAPSESDPLRKHIKGLTDYVNFLDLLQEILGETPEPSMCVARLLAAIKASLLKGRSKADQIWGATEEVNEELKERTAELQRKLTANGSSTGISPARPRAHAVNHSTALGGRDTVKLLAALLDDEAVAPPCRNKAELLSEEAEPVVGGAERTCILPLFRSPQVSTGDSPEPLKNRVQNRRNLLINNNKCALVPSQFGCTYRDEPLPLNKPLPLSRVLDFPSSSQVHPAPKPRPLTTSGNEDTPTDGGVPPEQRSGNAPKVRTGAGRSNKRKQTSRDGAENEPPRKKALAAASVPKRRVSKASNRKPLIAGQGKLTGFFRV